MILQRCYYDKLAQASYLIGCPRTGEAAVIDPNRDVEPYIRSAERQSLQITRIAETHIHADFVSGARELSARTGATLYLSDEGDEDWKYAFGSECGATLLKDGDDFAVGSVRVQAVHTPGHTPEHLSFLVTDTARADRPMGVITGDFVFVGDVGRPDLLETSAGVAGSMEAGARSLFRTLQKFREFPDYLQVWPGHGAGSACGKAIGSVPQTTVGYERSFNWALTIEEEEEFVLAVLDGQPETPKYFAEMKRINKQGPSLLGGIQRPPRLPARRLGETLARNSLVVDARSAADFAAGHVPHSISIPLDGGFPTWAGWLVPYDREFYLLLDDECGHCVEEAARDLAMIGLDRLSGYFGAEAIGAWKAEGGALQSVPQTTVEGLARRLSAGTVDILDVRGAAEWEAGHLPGATNVFVGHLADRLDEVSRERPVVVHCASGARSAIAAGVLQANGFDNVINLVGGYQEWVAAGLPTEAPEKAGASEESR